MPSSAFLKLNAEAFVVDIYIYNTVGVLRSMGFGFRDVFWLWEDAGVYSVFRLTCHTACRYVYPKP